MPPSGEAEASGGETLYASFWGLQSAFADPSAAMAPAAWALLVERLESVLQVFANIVSKEPVAEAAAAVPTEGEGCAPVDADGEPMGLDEQADTMGKEVYFAKFLTSPKLLQLQLRDSYFRRHVLVCRWPVYYVVCSESERGALLDICERCASRNRGSDCHQSTRSP